MSLCYVLKNERYRHKSRSKRSTNSNDCRNIAQDDAGPMGRAGECRRSRRICNGRRGARPQPIGRELSSHAPSGSPRMPLARGPGPPGGIHPARRGAARSSPRIARGMARARGVCAQSRARIRGRAQGGRRRRLSASPTSQRIARAPTTLPVDVTLVPPPSGPALGLTLVTMLIATGLLFLGARSTPEHNF